MIGVFDSGIGGLSVLKALRAELPLEHFIYIADSAHAPYGERDAAYVVRRSRAISKYLKSLNVEALVIACNTATAAAIALLRADHPGLAIIGVEPAVKPAVRLSRTRHIGVIATRSTLASAKFQALLASQAGWANFTMQPCDDLAVSIERSMLTGDNIKTIADCTRYINSMGRFGSQNGQIDTLVLGCTHYPFASAHLHALLGPNVQLVDNSGAVARQTRRQLEKAGALRASPGPASAGKISLFSTGQTDALDAAAQYWLGPKVAITSKKLRF